MKALQYGEALFAKAIRVGDVFDKGTLNEKFIEEVHESIRLSLREYWATQPHADLIDLAFRAQYLIAIQGWSTTMNQLQQNAGTKKYQPCRQWGKNTVNVVDSDSSSSRSRSKKTATVPAHIRSRL